MGIAYEMKGEELQRRVQWWVWKEHEAGGYELWHSVDARMAAWAVGNGFPICLATPGDVWGLRVPKILLRDERLAG